MRRLSRKLSFFLGGALIFGFAPICSAQSNSPVKDYNVIIILVDALRADHLSCYGYFRKTPNVDRFSSRSLLFENCISQAYYTLPSHASIFTSQYVHSHQVTTKYTRLLDKETTLAEILKIYGYKNALFAGGIYLEPVYGFTQGFDTYYAKTAEFKEGTPFRMGKSEEIYPRALKWIEENRKNKFFIFIHSYDLYMPTKPGPEFENKYDPGYKGIAQELLSLDRLHLRKTPGGTFLVGRKGDPDIREVSLNEKDKRHIIANYDAGVSYSDSFIKRLLDKLDQLNLTEKSLIILTADHGTDLFDHGTMHMYMDGSAYEEVIHVPLIISIPGPQVKAARIKTQVQLIDLMPTILDFLGIPVNSEAEGRSLMPLIRGDAGKDFNRSVFSGWNKIQAIRQDDWKLIFSRGAFELYNLKSDPREQKNLAPVKYGVFLGRLKNLFSWTNVSHFSLENNQIELNPGMVKKLKEAGYW